MSFTFAVDGIRLLVYPDHNQVSKVLGVHIGVSEIFRSGKDLFDVGVSMCRAIGGKQSV